MPDYDFICNACGKPFTLFILYDDYGKKKALCPVCGSDDNRRRIGHIRVGRGESQKSPEGAVSSPDFNEKDPRQIGTMLRELQEQSGISMPTAYGEMAERLEKGDSIADIDRDMPAFSDDPDFD